MMATIPQGFPQVDSPILDIAGNLSIPWIQFFITMWNRSGGSKGTPGNTSFNYPLSPGTLGQVLTSAGSGNPTTWSNVLTKLSQFTNDTGFITASALTGYSTSAQTDARTLAQIQKLESNTIPQPDTNKGSAGAQSAISRADHSHPRETSPSYAGTVTANMFETNGVTWTAGAGAPSGVQPNGSLYSNSSGTTGGRLFVSNGSTWTAVTGV